MMRIGGFEVSDAQRDVLTFLAKNGPGRLGTWNKRTVNSLQKRGFIEQFVPDATTYSMAARGRIRYWRLTKAGEAVAEIAKTRNLPE